MTLSEYLSIPDYLFSLEFGGGYYHQHYNENIYLHFKTRQVQRNICNLDKKQSLSKQLNIPILIEKNLIHRPEPIINFEIVYDKFRIYAEKIILVTEHNQPTKYVLAFPMKPPTPNSITVKPAWDFEAITPETHNVIYEK